MDKINILHIYQNSKIGGVQQQILSLIKAYDKDIINPSFCCLGPKEEMGDEMENEGIDFTALDISRHHKLSLRMIMELRRLMTKKCVHVVRTHRYSASLYGRIAAKMTGVPVVIASVHDNYRKDLRFRRRLANRVLSKATDKVVAVSESIKEDIIKYDKIDTSKILVIPNGVDTLRFNPERKFEYMRKGLSISDDDIVIGSVGRLVPAKGLEYLIEAASYLRKEFKTIKIVMVGDGSLLDSLRHNAKENYISDIVIFTGQRRDIPDILSCMDIFAMPSIAEGLPNSLLEAMSMGKPIVAAAVGGIPYVIENGINGLLVQPRDSKGLAAAVETIIKDKQLSARIGQNARDFVEQNYSIKATAQKWEFLYKSLLKEKGMSFE